MKPTIICLTPVRNEAWILDRFLKAASLWADYIIIADQMSTDGSREIAKKYPKVILIDNSLEAFNEPERQKLLIKEARKINGQKLLITLDADEIFTPNVIDSEEWKQVLTAAPGTIFKFQWANILPDFNTYWQSDFFPWGYMDDGFEHNQNEKIHTSRIPIPHGVKSIEIKTIKVMHFQYSNWERMQSKHRWYECYERITFPEKRPINIFRMYHHMYALPKEKIEVLPTKWIADYLKLKIDVHNNNISTLYWWDEKVMDYFDQYGIEYFKKLSIWDVNWMKIAQKWRRANNEYYDPRTFADKCIQLFLKISQKYQNYYIVRKLEKVSEKYFSY